MTTAEANAEILSLLTFWGDANGLPSQKPKKEKKIMHPEIVVVTRHPALVTLLRERGLIEEGCHVLEHVIEADVRGKHVIGVLPLSLAALAMEVTEIPLSLTPEMRGKELGLETLRQIAGEAVTYMVTVQPRGGAL